MDQFIILAVQNAFEPDSLNSTQPMNYETSYPGGGAPSFVSYPKGNAKNYFYINIISIYFTNIKLKIKFTKISL